MYALMIGNCVLCGNPFGFNPHKVPSIRVNARGLPDQNAPRQPICRDCHTAANQVRRERGLAPWPNPAPDAYDPIPDYML